MNEYWYNINRWYNIELEQSEAERLHSFLTEELIKHEVSGCFNLLHFEIFIADKYEYELVTEYIRSL